MPEDFSIGPLADPRAGTDDEKAALAAAAALLASVAAGTPDGSRLTEDSREAVLDLLGPASRVNAGPLAFRLGSATTLPTGEISINLRLLRGEGSAEGEIYVRSEGSRWLVSDVQVDPARSPRRAAPGRTFLPLPVPVAADGGASGTTE